MPVTLDLKSPHRAQRRILREAARFNVVACGRRLGKTDTGVEHICLPAMLEGKPCAWFAPTYKLLDEAWVRFLDVLRPFRNDLKVSKVERQIKLPTGGLIDFWTLSNTTEGRSDAGRGRKYAVIVVDEAAMARYLKDDWTTAIRPTLADYRGSAWFLSTPRGRDFFWRLWKKGEASTKGWKSWRLPTRENPYISEAEIEDARRDLPRDAFSQEYLAEFLADAANPFGITAIHSCIRTGEPAGRDVAVWGVDLAKSTDWTVAIGLDTGGRVVAFQRWQSDWRNTTKRVAAMIGSTPALIDSTGVGDPIVEELQALCPLVEGYKFTMASKQQLMEGLAVAIQSRGVEYPDGVIVHELESFQYEYTRTGVRYTAPEGEHDDCVDSLALAVRCASVGLRPVEFAWAGQDRVGQDARWMDRVEDEEIWN